MEHDIWNSVTANCDYTKKGSHQTLEKENQSMQKEIKLLKTSNHNLTEENNILKSYISAILEAIKHFFRKILHLVMISLKTILRAK